MTALPTDVTGYLSLVCPACARRFKVHEPLAGETRRCLYCGHAGTPGAFFTPAQRAALQGEAPPPREPNENWPELRFRCCSACVRFDGSMSKRLAHCPHCASPGSAI